MRLTQLKVLLIIALSTLILTNCEPPAAAEMQVQNPHAKGFQLGDSDEKAIAIADDVMDAMGGRKAWDDTDVLNWTFFGRRKHIWDKKNKKAMVYSPNDDMTVLLNLENGNGSVSRGGMEITNQDSVQLFLDQGMKAWINDSYWLVMPFKLKDSGVTLKYIGEGSTEAEKASEILELTFDNVGVTPQNKYHVYVDKESNLVTQWDFYSNASDSLPRFKSAWPNYAQYGKILLSGGVIGGNSLSEISVTPLYEDIFSGI